MVSGNAGADAGQWRAGDLTAAGAGHETPAIPVSAGALIFDRAGRLLILRPTYKSGWTIPGGVMEADGESPWQACRREVLEECGIEVTGGRLACMDFRTPRPGRLGGVRYLFDCGALGDDVLAAIVIQPEEILRAPPGASAQGAGTAPAAHPAAGARGLPRPGPGLPGGRPPGAGRRPGLSPARPDGSRPAPARPAPAPD